MFGVVHKATSCQRWQSPSCQRACPSRYEQIQGLSGVFMFQMEACNLVHVSA